MLRGPSPPRTVTGTSSTGREAVPLDLLVAACDQSPNHALLAHDHRRHAQIGVAGLAVEISAELPARHEGADHVAADDPVRRLAEDVGQVAERDVAEVVCD